MNYLAGDLFCGCGGMATGAINALNRRSIPFEFWAVNHWERAVETMMLNHPTMHVFEADLSSARPRDIVECGRLNHLHASPSCFTKGHLVTTSEGQKPIENVGPGDLVLTHRGRWRRVVRKQARYANETVIVQGAGHYGIECTPSHKFWLMPSEMDCTGRRHAVRVYGEPQWMRIDRALCNEALWSTPYSIEPLPEKKLPKRLMELSRPYWVIGRWLGDGWLGSGRHYDVTICCAKSEEPELTSMLVSDRKWARLETRTTVKFTLTDRETCEWLMENFGCMSYGKYIPTWCLTLSEDKRKDLLEGYLSADGNCTQRRTTASTVSKALAVTLRMLCESLGHRTGLNFVKARPYHIEGRTGEARDQYRIHFENELCEKRSKESFVSDGMVWSRVRKITYNKHDCVVYNIEVEEDHSYVLDGIVVKNCTHHSRACGGRPRNNQLRAQPNWVLDWLDDLKVERLSIENVPEFTTWGPLDDEGKPVKSQKGTLFDLWLQSIEARNYKVEWQIVNCADYGDATSRKRFFLKAVKKGCGEIRWPKPTYSKDGSTGLKWRGVKECLDFSDTGTSIFNRKKPLAAATMERIAVGAAKYWGVDLRPFIVRMNRHCYAESIDSPCSAITTSGAHHMLCTPIVMDHFNNGEVQDGSLPMGTQTTHDRYSLVTPIVMSHWSNGGCQDGSLPLGSQTTKDHFSLVTPIVMSNNGNNVPRSVDDPCPALTTGNRNFLCTALVLGQQGGAACRPVDEPCPTVACGGAIRSIFPQLDDGRIVDIHIRMLRPDELARVHSFPDDYVITGNRCEKVKQIGNSVPVRTAEAMMAADLDAA